MEKCRRGDLDSGTLQLELELEFEEESWALAIGHWHVCRFMQHFSNYIRVGRHYNGNYTQEPQDMPVGGWPWSLGWGRGIPAALSSSRGAATWSTDARLWWTTVAAAEGPVTGRLDECPNVWLNGPPAGWLTPMTGCEVQDKNVELNSWNYDTGKSFSYRDN